MWFKPAINISMGTLDMGLLGQIWGKMCGEVPSLVAIDLFVGDTVDNPNTPINMIMPV